MAPPPALTIHEANIDGGIGGLGGPGGPGGIGGHGGNGEGPRFETTTIHHAYFGPLPLFPSGDGRGTLYNDRRPSSSPLVEGDLIQHRDIFQCLENRYDARLNFDSGRSEAGFSDSQATLKDPDDVQRAPSLSSPKGGVTASDRALSPFPLPSGKKRKAKAQSGSKTELRRSKRLVEPQRFTENTRLGTPLVSSPIEGATANSGLTLSPSPPSRGKRRKGKDQLVPGTELRRSKRLVQTQRLF